MATKTSTSVSFKGQVIPKMVRDLRREMGLTAQQFGAELGNGLPGYSRGYVIAVERKLLPITERFAARFKLLRATVMGERVLSKEIVSRYYLPRRLVIVSKSKRCPVCRWHFLGVTPIQKYCGEKCAHAARRKRNGHERKSDTRK